MSMRRRKQVKCTMCTSYRWMGNKKDRHKASELKKLNDAKKQIQDQN